MSERVHVGTEHELLHLEASGMISQHRRTA